MTPPASDSAGSITCSRCGVRIYRVWSLYVGHYWAACTLQRKLAAGECPEQPIGGIGFGPHVPH